MNKIEQPELRDQMKEHFDDEVQLIDYLRVIWKWKWLIILGTFLCMVVAGVVSFNMPKIYEVSMTIEPGIIGVNRDGKFIYLDSRDNIEGKIKEGLYNRRIQKALNINPLETDIKFEVRPQKGTNFIKVTSEWKDPEVEFGKKALVNLLGFISKEYENIVQQRKGDYEKQILMEQNQIKENEATLKIIRDREKELLQEIKNVKDNTEKIVRERNNVLQHKGNSDDISLLIYSTTIQQNVAYFNQLSNQINDIRTKKEIASMKIENLKAQIDRLNLEKSIIKNIRVLQNPEASLSPIKPKKRLNILLAGVIAFMMMMFLVFFVEYIQKAKRSTIVT
ncbi:MAG TPA: Wzz/FepE/Etk N-terminal domain-containing protein [Desulfatiglandales bacterium]|nr:Wzz/FepE/Etk N-terminal domain-containing protein [Desulfatiglandales bacterium]